MEEEPHIGILNFTHNMACDQVPALQNKVMPMSYFTTKKERT
jgi:hypothetical protein